MRPVSVPRIRSDPLAFRFATGPVWRYISGMYRDAAALAARIEELESQLVEAREAIQTEKDRVERTRVELRLVRQELRERKTAGRGSRGVSTAGLGAAVGTLVGLVAYGVMENVGFFALPVVLFAFFGGIVGFGGKNDDDFPPAAPPRLF